MHTAAHPPRRTLLRVCAAWAGGSYLGCAAGLEAGLELGLAFGLLVGAGLACALAPRAHKLAGALVLGALAASAASRASALGPGAADADPGAAWSVRELQPGAERASTGRARVQAEIAPGVVEEGARVALAPRSLMRLPARGPVADPDEGPSAAGGRGRVRELLPDELVRLEPAHGFLYLGRPLARLRSAALARIEGLHDPAVRGLCAALLLGDTSLFAPGEQDRYVRTGTYHLLVVSGTQVVLLSWLVFAPLARALAALFERIARGRLRPELLALPAVALYVPMAGGDAPVLRAALVFALVPFAPRSNAQSVPRRCDGLTLWAAALCCECAWDPRAASSLSVELSYAATLGLVLASGPALAWLARGLGPPGLSRVDSLGRARPEFLCVASTRAALSLRTALVASVVAVIATAPLVLGRFGELCPSGILSTVLLLPPTSLLLVLAALHAFLGLPVPEQLLTLCARATDVLVRAFDALPLSPAEVPPRPFLLWAAVAVALLGALRCASPARARTLLRAAALLCGIALLPWTAAPVESVLVALDVGHGTCAAVRASDGSAWIFDAGTRDRTGLARGALGPLLAAWDPGCVRYALSHSERDHDGALDWVLERYPPALWAGAEPAHPGERPAHAFRRVDLAGRGVLELSGDPSARVWLLRGSTQPGNEGSRSLVLEGPEGLLWLAGDAVEEGLRGQLEAWNGPWGPVQVLLLPHHGGESSQLGGLLRALEPRQVWISSSERPASAAEVLRRGIRLRWTSREGPLVLDVKSP
ncbi:MAG: ComEC/Rec2 family competence protein [Planctomycetes bacterium]|nr:ComEC/Rec2 family competence protein [Planctomycetota bacterium]